MFYLTEFYICFYSANYKVQRWDIHKQEFLESAPGLGMFVTVTTPSAEVNMLYGCFCRIYELTFGTGRQHYLKITDTFGEKVNLVYQLARYFDAERYTHLVISIKANGNDHI